MNLDKDWLDILDKYGEIKRVYIECEETDPQLKTNLQPLNEFRAALDHVMKMQTALYVDENEDEYNNQKEKLHSHLNRAFYDICDMLSINYRNKIINIIEGYSVDIITAAIPDYYSDKRDVIENISLRIAKYRNQKGGRSVDSVERFKEYSSDVLKLKEIYIEILSKQSVLDEVKGKVEKADSKQRCTERIIGGIIGAIASAIVALVLHIFGF